MRSADARIGWGKSAPRRRWEIRSVTHCPQATATGDSGECGLWIRPLWRGQPLRFKRIIVSADATVADRVSPIDKLL